MADFDLDWKGGEIPSNYEKPWDDANLLMSKAIVQETTSNKWQWPNPPSPRDVVDLGQFRDSIRPEKESPDSWLHTFNVDYAMAVINGAVFQDGRTMPGRDVTEVPVSKLAENFQRLLR